jgi:hypothetical protein
LPREVFFGRLGFAGAFFTVWASDFERFLPATSDSFPIDVLPDAPYPGSRRPVPWVGFRLARVYAVAVHADLLETVGRKRAVTALIGLRAGARKLEFSLRRGCRGMAEVRQFLFPRAMSDKNTVGVWAPYLRSARPFGRSGPDNRGGSCPAASISVRTAGHLRRGSVRASPCSFDPCGAGSARPSAADPRRAAVATEPKRDRPVRLRAFVQLGRSARRRGTIGARKCRSPLTLRSSGFDVTTISRGRGRCQ